MAHSSHEGTDNNGDSKPSSTDVVEEEDLGSTEEEEEDEEEEDSSNNNDKNNDKNNNKNNSNDDKKQNESNIRTTRLQSLWQLQEDILSKTMMSSRRSAAVPTDTTTTSADPADPSAITTTAAAAHPADMMMIPTTITQPGVIAVSGRALGVVAPAPPPYHRTGGVVVTESTVVDDATGVSVLPCEDEDPGNSHHNYYGRASCGLRRSTVVVMLLTLLFLLFLVTVLVVVVILRADNDESSTSLRGKSTNDVDLLPTLAPTTANFPDLIAKLQTLSGSAVFQDPSSPQYQAAHWLASTTSMEEEDDTTKRTTTTTTTALLLQRYTLAVFYFALNGDSWDMCNRIVPRCTTNTWDGEKQQSWLSSSSSFSEHHECTWFGVTCNEQDVVISIDFDLEEPRNAAVKPQMVLQGRLPTELSSLDQLQELILPRHDISGPLFPMLSSLQNLKIIHVEDNQLTGTLSTLHRYSKHLERLDLQNNQFHGSISAIWENDMTLLQHLRLDNNQFTGSIEPMALSKLPNIRTLSLQNNHFSGVVPSYLFHENLELLHLGGNTLLQGSLPPTERLARMTKLRRLDLGDTQMGGTLPEGMYHLPQLQELHLPRANFHGVLSEDFRFLNRTIQEVDLQGNDFSGTVPAAFDVCVKLDYLDLSDNPQISGSISKIFCDNRHSGSFLDVDCPVICHCCGFRDSCDRFVF